jgi:putative transposase
MRKSRFSEQQILGILKEHQAGPAVAKLCHKHGISDAGGNHRRSGAGIWEMSVRISGSKHL